MSAQVPAAFAQLVGAAATRYQVPKGVLADVLAHESAWNPSAVHVNSGGSVDRGIAQINSWAHPNVTASQAFSPSFAIPWAARFLRAKYTAAGTWRQAVAAYNPGAPGYASAVLGAPGANGGRYGATANTSTVRRQAVAAYPVSASVSAASGSATSQTSAKSSAAGVPAGAAAWIERYGWEVLAVLGIGLVLLALVRWL